ncbi:MAG: hypothetical protein VYA17_02820 [Pseudomonadota bacterium]|nr:hypothetical protein [Pseudomonadota bacterium]
MMHYTMEKGGTVLKDRHQLSRSPMVADIINLTRYEADFQPFTDRMVPAVFLQKDVCNRKGMPAFTP